MQPAMNPSECSNEFDLLRTTWNKVKPRQRRNIIAWLKIRMTIRKVYHGILPRLDEHIQKRRARFVYWFDAHWVKRIDKFPY